MSMSAFFIIAVLLLGFLIVFQIAKASEYVAVLKGEKKTFEQNNRINGFLLLAFLILGLVGVYWCNALLKPKILGEAASDHGQKIDQMLYITLIITGIVFVLTQVLLFWFAFKYQYKENRKAFYFPHNNKLELIWTVIPAITLTILVGFGLYYWFKITGDAPKDSLVVEITGKQFAWVYRYPGKDNTFGKKYYKNINEAQSNQLGLLWDDPASHDDIVTTEALYVVKGQPVKLVINSRDVVHDVGLSHFRMKMDAVPGTPTTMWFTPLYTTEEMKQKTNNPNFEYEISCDQMCGKGHYSMKGIIKVVSQSDFILWRAKQKSNYAQAFPEKVPSAATPAPAADSTKSAKPAADSAATAKK
ncbi:cytochrome c oxidase subunit II [Pinibacter aurantiacus]|nr:cytochrome c oxidase subunit II [Pinibacter aurantiacus]